jgi:hypothetical protein
VHLNIGRWSLMTHELSERTKDGIRWTIYRLISEQNKLRGENDRLEMELSELIFHMFGMT